MSTVSFDLSKTLGQRNIETLREKQRSRLVAVFLLHRSSERFAYVVLNKQTLTAVGEDHPYDYALPVWGDEALRRAFLVRDMLDITTESVVCAAAGRIHTQSMEERVASLMETVTAEWPRTLRIVSNSGDSHANDRVLAASITNTPDSQVEQEFSPAQMVAALVAEAVGVNVSISLDMQPEVAHARLASITRKVAWLQDRLKRAKTDSQFSDA